MAHKCNLLMFAGVFIILGWMGVEAVTPAYKELGTRMTQIYFLFFAVMAIHSKPFATELQASSVFFVIGLCASTALRSSRLAGVSQSVELALVQKTSVRRLRRG